MYQSLDMLCSTVFTSKVFNTLPQTTNAIESHNRCSKGTSPDILKVAMMSTYKVDMAAALEHLAASKGVVTSYENLSPAARVHHSKMSNNARNQKRTAEGDAEGPPDKHQHFKKVQEFV